MKKLIITFVISLFAAEIFALTPHINKGKLNKISVTEAVSVLGLSEKEMKDVNKDFYGILEENNTFPPVMEADFNSDVQIFKQTFTETNEIIYRVISVTKEQEPLSGSGIFQKAYYSNGNSKPNLIFADFYDADAEVFGQSVTRVHLNYNFMPVIKNKKIAGIMIYGIESFNKLKSIVGDEGSEENIYHKAAVFWRDDFSKANLRNSYSNRADIYIDCSKPLIDDKDTFKYTVQNAFDKNPATSYVEDTEDDLMFISFGAQMQLEKIALINGYAKDNYFYKINNRIKTVGIEAMNDKSYEVVINNRFTLTDFEEKFQIFEITKLKGYINMPSIKVESIYKGEKFSDTCIAEIDYFYKKYGWLFGGIN